MPGFEEEAFLRAQQMHRRGGSERRTERQNEAEPRQQKTAGQENASKPAAPPAKAAGSANRTAFEGIFRDKDKSLIILLIILLMDEKNDPSLLLSLMYLLL